MAADRDLTPETERARVAARRQPHRTHEKSLEPMEESEEWVISYMDMVTVLMIVFLGMVAILGMDGRLSNPSNEEREATKQVDKALASHPLPSPFPTLHREDDADYEAPPPARPPGQGGPADRSGNAAVAGSHAAASLSPAAQAWLRKLEAAGLPPDVDITLKDRKVAIVVRDRILFPSGSATLQPAAVDLLRTLAPSLAALPGSITVEGHSDDVAISTARFPSNWELSAARAAAVVRVLATLGLPPERLGALGLADSRPLTTDPTRRSENRRVEIVVDTDAVTAKGVVR